MDKIEKLGSSLIQHGKHSDRIYLMKLSRSDFTDITKALKKIAQIYQYSKIFAKVPESMKTAFIRDQYRVEAEIPGFFKGKEKGLFMAKFLKPDRSQLPPPRQTRITRNIKLAISQPVMDTIQVDKKFQIGQLSVDYVSELSELYRMVFQSYPFPIHDPEYLKKTMEENLIYFGVFHEDRLVAAASSEMYYDYQNVEMTDFATHPDYRGKKLALILLDLMEKKMVRRNMKCLYTIARSHSAGMNITFARKGYKFGGTLINNTNISGEIESMNVWYKNTLQPLSD